MSRVICKFIPSSSIPATHLRFAPLCTAASTSSRMAAQPSSSSSSSTPSSPSPPPPSIFSLFVTVSREVDRWNFFSENMKSEGDTHGLGKSYLLHGYATKRAGWVKRGVQEPESIADHMYRMGLMALIASDNPSVNREKCIKMAIVHDIAEAIVGDITPSDGVPKEEKSRHEQEALQKMCELLGGGERAQEIKELWMEYEENSSMEAKVVKDFDKVEMILQALEYETGQGSIHTQMRLRRLTFESSDISRDSTD
ncbi:hypothetical protein SASPL_108925 [Salvia splendens]|uniref:5'-deoxynucleotidase n=1 Tax=Salvia splendens TaxID=180675 RepID=A0A8X8YHL4_SALSN|nr:hypothetical protein SASPL_108925 [Salvia splendens]